ncbi:MAG: ABC transporter ATP-binding protein [Deltaproteobacteria bacterium]|nr:ABC transporter ATP-binding protein [Deltaproteobacteria bacterium]
MSEILLKVDNLNVHFATEDGIVKALDGISFEIEKGKTLGLVGETGCGKSVTANAILQLLPQKSAVVSKGQILFQGRDLLKVPPKELRQIRGADIAMIFQDPFTSLNPAQTVGAQIAEAIGLHQDVNNKEALKRAADIMDSVGIPEAQTRLKNYPHQFSGGMRQRVMIAMGLACSPKLLIADEPTTALDVTIQAQILDLMSALIHKTDMAMLLISHDLGVISEMSDYLAIMYAGCVVETAASEVFFTQHKHPYSEGLLESIPRIGHRKQTLSVISGSVPNLLNPPSGCRFHPRCPVVMDHCRNHKPELKELSPGHKVACFNVTE